MSWLEDIAELAKTPYAPLTEKQSARVHELKELLWTRVHDLLDEFLVDEDPEVSDLVRTQMTEQSRFWKRT